MIKYIEEISIGNRMKMFNLLYNLRFELQAEDKWTTGLCHCILKKTRGAVHRYDVVQFVEFAFRAWPEGNGSTNYPIKVRTFTGFRHAVTQYDIVRDCDKLNFVTRLHTYSMRVRFINKRKRLLDYLIKILAESIGEKMR